MVQLDTSLGAQIEWGASALRKIGRLCVSGVYLAIRFRSLLWIFLFALALRAGFVLHKEAGMVFPDEQDYHTIARNLIEEGEFREADGRRACRAPGYPIFLAGLYVVGLDSPRAIYLIQAVVGAATCVLIALLGARWYGVRAGKFAGWLAVIYPFFIFYTGLLLSETLFICGLAGFLLLLNMLRPEEERSRRQVLLLVLAIGVVAGVMIHLRSSFLLFPICILPFLLFRDRPRGKVLLRWGGMMLVIGLVLLPWIVRNACLFNRFVPTTLQVGESLYEANSPYADGGPAMDRIPWDEISGGPLSEVERNDFFRQRAVEHIREDPGRFLRLAVAKFRRFWNPVPNYGPYRTPFYLAVSAGSVIPVYVLAVCGLLWHRWSRRLLVLLSPVIYFTLLHMIFVGSIRYRTPVMPALLVLAGAGAAPFWERLKEHLAPGPGRRAWKVWLGVGGLVALILGGVIAFHVYTRPARLRRMARERLTELAGAPVQVEQAQYSLLQGLILHEVAVQDKTLPEGRPALHVSTLILRPDLSALLRGRLAWDVVEMEDVSLDVRFDEANRWRFLQQVNLAEETAPGDAPQLMIHRAEVSLSGLTTEYGDMPPLDIKGVNVLVTPLGEGRGVRTRLWTERQQFGRLNLQFEMQPSSEQAAGTLSVTGLTVESGFRDMLPPELQKQWDAFSPLYAQVEANAEFTWDANADPAVRVAGDVYLRDGQVNHPLLPYAVRSVYTDIHVDGRSFEATRFLAVAGEALLSGSARARLTDDGELEGELTVRADGMRFDDRFIPMLPEQLRPVWAQVQPSGKLNVVAHLRAASPLDRSDIFADVELVDCACELPGMPVRLAGVNGELKYAGNRLDFRGITGKVAKGEIEVEQGFAELRDGGAFRVGIEAKGLNFDMAAEEVTSPLVWYLAGEGVRRQVSGLTMQGEAGFSLLAFRNPGERETHRQADLRLRGITLTHPDFGHDITDVTGNVSLDGDMVRTGGLALKWGEGKIELPAQRVSLRSRDRERVALAVRGLPLDDTVIAFLPKFIKRTIDQVNPSGIMDVDAEIVWPGKAGRAVDVNVNLTGRDGEFSYVGFPYEVKKVSGRLVMEGPDLILAEFKGRHGDTLVEVGLKNIEREGTPWRQITVRGTNGTIDEDLRNALGPDARALWEVLKPEGGLDVVYVRQHQRKPWRTDIYRVSTDVLLHDVTVQLGEPVLIKSGKVTVAELLPTDEGSAYQGSASVGAMTTRDMTATDIKLRFEGGEQSGRLMLQNIEGAFYDGVLTGHISLPSVGAVEEQPGFEGVVTLTDADAAAVAAANGYDEIAGRLDVTAAFSGEIGADDPVHCRGALTIREGEIGQLPGMLALLNVVRLYGLDAPAFHSVELAYELKEGDFIAHNLSLRGESLTLVGRGVLHEDDSYDFRFRPELVGEGGLPTVGPVINSLKDFLMPVTLKGTVEEPVWDVDLPLDVRKLLPQAIEAFNPLRLLRLAPLPRPKPATDAAEPNEE